MKNKKVLFAGAAVVLVVIFALAANFYKNYESERIGFLAQENASVFIRDHSPQYGNKDARVYLIEFLDPECESCRLFYPQVKSLLKEFGDKVKLVVRYAPFHRNSKIAIRALDGAKNQGKYWEALELLFKHQPEWGSHHNPQPEKIFEILPQLGLDMDRVRSDMKNPDIEKMIAQDIADLRKLNVRGTPTFFVNGKPVARFGIDALREAIQEAVKEAY
ncbi:MAG: thioredoxin domain-containing protein [Bacteriovoracaceae bacterium]|nr:thioredoxin domain-containing protein [Bacteriovoracaceae bacterium]